MQWLSLLGPIAYLGILLGSLATFSYAYRQRQVTAKLKLAPYFPAHTSRNIYLSLLHLPDSSDNEKSSTKVPDSILRAALLNRAVEDIHRIMEIRTRKPALAQLLQRGVVGDEMMQRMQRAEQELEIELKDVVAEANALAPGWGQTIFQSAGEMAQNKMLKDKVEEVRKTLPKELENWELQREGVRRELEGELEEEKAMKGNSSSKEKGGAGGAQTPSQLNSQDMASPTTPGTGTISAGVVGERKTTSSDEDTVLVETPGGGEGVESSTGGGGKNKKKKNKK